jgi:UPF0755 protein
MKKSKKKQRKTKIAVTIFLSIAIAFIALVAVSYTLLTKKIKAKEIIVKIAKNASSRKIVEEFNTFGALEPKGFFLPVVRMYSIIAAKPPVAGTYKFTNQNTNLDIIKSIFSGKNLSVVKVTYPEGITLRDFALITQKNLGVDTIAFFEAIKKGDYIQKLKIPVNSIEGYLMPETYFFYYGTDAEIVISKLIETQNKIWVTKFSNIAAEKGLTRHFVLTLASLIELESPLEEERKRISGVFYNRLNKGMKLESDPTIQYSLQEKKRLKYSDLEIESPYNTYKFEGLPPGPICSPGVSAIEAALFPEKHDFLYFVSYGDGSGRHRFAKTYSEHLKNKKLFKKALKEQVPSTK